MVVAGAAFARSLCTAGIAVVQEHPDFKKALRASKANASSCITFFSFYLSALFINLKIHTMHHVSFP